MVLFLFIRWWHSCSLLKIQTSLTHCRYAELKSTRRVRWADVYWRPKLFLSKMLLFNKYESVSVRVFNQILLSCCADCKIFYKIRMLDISNTEWFLFLKSCVLLCCFFSSATSNPVTPKPPLFNTLLYSLVPIMGIAVIVLFSFWMYRHHKLAYPPVLVPTQVSRCIILFFFER